jgi:Zn-dependent protease
MFLGTVVSTFWVGMVAGAGPISPEVFLRLPDAYRNQLIHSGLVYSGGLLLILGFHEMGHYLQARRYGIQASLPYFIPMPISPFGTMGAVIIQGEHAGNRKTLFDIAVSGPLAGLVVAIPLLYLGLANTTSAPLPPHHTGIVYGDPPILRWMFEAIHGPLPVGNEIILTPLVFAAWVGGVHHFAEFDSRGPTRWRTYPVCPPAEKSLSRGHRLPGIGDRLHDLSEKSHLRASGRAAVIDGTIPPAHRQR